MRPSPVRPCLARPPAAVGGRTVGTFPRSVSSGPPTRKPVNARVWSSTRRSSARQSAPVAPNGWRGLHGVLRQPAERESNDLVTGVAEPQTQRLSGRRCYVPDRKRILKRPRRFLESTAKPKYPEAASRRRPRPSLSGLQQPCRRQESGSSPVGPVRSAEEPKTLWDATVASVRARPQPGDVGVKGPDLDPLRSTPMRIGPQCNRGPELDQRERRCVGCQNQTAMRAAVTAANHPTPLAGRRSQPGAGGADRTRRAHQRVPPGDRAGSAEKDAVLRRSDCAGPETETREGLRRDAGRNAAFRTSARCVHTALPLPTAPSGRGLASNGVLA